MTISKEQAFDLLVEHDVITSINRQNQWTSAYCSPELPFADLAESHKYISNHCVVKSTPQEAIWAAVQVKLGRSLDYDNATS